MIWVIAGYMCVYIQIYYIYAYIYIFFSPTLWTLHKWKIMMLCVYLLPYCSSIPFFFLYPFAHSENLCGESAVKPGHRRESDLPKISWLISGMVRTWIKPVWLKATVLTAKSDMWHYDMWYACVYTCMCLCMREGGRKGERRKRERGEKNT